MGIFLNSLNEEQKQNWSLALFKLFSHVRFSARISHFLYHSIIICAPKLLSMHRICDWFRCCDAFYFTAEIEQTIKMINSLWFSNTIFLPWNSAFRPTLLSLTFDNSSTSSNLCRALLMIICEIKAISIVSKTFVGHLLSSYNQKPQQLNYLWFFFIPERFHSFIHQFNMVTSLLIHTFIGDFSFRYDLCLSIRIIWIFS